MVICIDDDLTEDEANATADEMMNYLTGSKGFSIVLYGDNAYTDAELEQYGLPERTYEAGNPEYCYHAL